MLDQCRWMWDCCELFKGCCLCRRAPEPQEYHINSQFYRNLDFSVPGSVSISSGSNCHRICRRIYVILSNIHPKMSPRLFEKFTFNTFVKNWTSIGVLWETGWGKMFVLTVGSFQVFIKRGTLTRVLQIKVNVFQKTLIFIFSVQTIYSSLEDRYVRRLFCRIYNITHFLFSEQIYPIDVQEFS